MASSLRELNLDPFGQQPQRIPIYRDEPEFVDRVRNNQNYPVINNPDGSVSTHRMAAESDANGNWYVFPTIQMQDGELVEYYDSRDAMDAAFKTGNILRAPNKQSALNYAEGAYKRGTGLGNKPTTALMDIEEFSRLSPSDPLYIHQDPMPAGADIMTQQEAISELTQREESARVAGTVSPFQSSFNPFNPNFRATAQNAISNMLGGSNISSSDNYLGGRVANTLTSLLDFTPVVGDAVGVGDAITSYKQDDMLGTGINMMGVVPIIGDAGVKLAKKTRSALRDSGFTEGFFHGTKQDIQDGFKAGYDDGMVFVSPNKEFASNWVGKGKYQDRIGEKDFYDMKQSDKQAVWDNYESQYGDFDNWPEEIVDEYFAKQSVISRQYDASGGAIYPVAVKANNQFDPESNPEIISEFLTRRGQNPLGTTLERGKTDLEVYQEGNYLLFENKEMADFLKDKGYDSLWLREDTTKTGLAKSFSTLAVLDETGVKPVYDFAREADTAASALRGLDMDQGARMQRAQDLELDINDLDEDQYIQAINPQGTRIAPEARPNLGMGDMYGMAPRNAEEIMTQELRSGETIRYVQDGDSVYALGYNPDLGEEDVVGYMLGGGDGSELAVVDQMQGKGIGGNLSYLYRSQNPMAQSGGFTEAGEAAARQAYRRIMGYE